jgi:hypothetical protein
MKPFEDKDSKEKDHSDKEIEIYIEEGGESL